MRAIRPARKVRETKLADLRIGVRKAARLLVPFEKGTCEASTEDHGLVLIVESQPLKAYHQVSIRSLADSRVEISL